MNPMLQEAIASILRHFLTIAAGYLVARGIWTQGSATSYVEAAALALISVGWAIWQKYETRQKLVTALAMTSNVKTEADIEKFIAQGESPSVTTPKTAHPIMVLPNPSSDRVKDKSRFGDEGGAATIGIISRASFATVVTLTLAIACAPKAGPTLSPEGKVALYGERFLSIVEKAQDQTIKLVADGVVDRASMEPAVRGFVEIGKIGQTTAKALRVIDASHDAIEKAAAAKTVDEGIRQAQVILLNLTKDIPNLTDRDRVLQIVNALNVGAALLDMLRAVAPYIPVAKVSELGGHYYDRLAA